VDGGDETTVGPRIALPLEQGLHVLGWEFDHLHGQDLLTI
jgi:hypothetical protein